MREDSERERAKRRPRFAAILDFSLREMTAGLFKKIFHSWRRSDPDEVSAIMTLGKP
jgi:hypothetical protein